MALKSWCQNNDYNNAAPAGCKTGCVPLAIGMLMYDIRWRPDGTMSNTRPSFSYQDQYKAYGKSVSLKLRQIADKIKDFKWGRSSSEAKVWAFNDYLRHNGFPNVGMVDFDLQTAYDNMCVAVTTPTGSRDVYHRGILLWGESSGPVSGNSDASHLWFCDGYREIAYKVTKYKKFLKWRKKKKSWIEYESQMYMNWGFDGDVNAWAVIENNCVKGSAYDKSLMILTGLNQYEAK